MKEGKEENFTVNEQKNYDTKTSAFVDKRKSCFNNSRNTFERDFQVIKAQRKNGYKLVRT